MVFWLHIRCNVLHISKMFCSAVVQTRIQLSYKYCQLVMYKFCEFKNYSWKSWLSILWVFPCTHTFSLQNRNIIFPNFTSGKVLEKRKGDEIIDRGAGVKWFTVKLRVSGEWIGLLTFLPGFEECGCPTVQRGGTYFRFALKLNYKTDARQLN